MGPQNTKYTEYQMQDTTKQTRHTVAWNKLEEKFKES